MDKLSGTPIRPGKRQKLYFSPDSPDTMETDKVGEMTRGQLVRDVMDSLSVLLDSKLATLATKEDVCQLSTRMKDLEDENRQLRLEVENMRNREKTVMNKLVDLEGRSRRNNLIFRGLAVSSGTRDHKQAVKKFCGEVFGNSDVFVNRAHPLDRNGKAIIAHIPEDRDVDYIMSRVRNLKGTGYAVHRDYPKEIRDKRACLSEIRVEIERVAGRKRMPLVFDHLIVDNVRFTWEDGSLRCGLGDGWEKLQTLTGHDFRDFLTALANREQTRTKRPAPVTATTARDGAIVSEEASVATQSG